jgi:YegS/Rv2252/BmrU family lipid kinase
MGQRALLLVNPHACRGENNLTATIAHLRSLGFDLDEQYVDHPRSISKTIREYGERVDLVIVGGGDGTLNTAIEGLIDTHLPLGILPLGTANDLARTLGIPTNLVDACEVIARGRQQWIDLGWVNGKHFFNVASLGLSVQITQQLNREVKRRWGVLAYAITALRVLFQSAPFAAEIRVQGESCKIRTVQIAIGNGRYYGGGLTVMEDAAINDQRLDLYSLEIDHWWQIIPLLPAMRSGTHASWSWVRAMRAEEFEIFTRHPHSINTDGEITTSTPAHFRVIPRALSVFVP